ERDEQQLHASIARDASDRSPQCDENSALLGETIQKDHVEDDPSDRQQPICHAEEGCASSHRDRHADNGDRHPERSGEPGERGGVCRNSPEREESKKNDEWQRRDNRRQRPVKRIVVLLPAHSVVAERRGGCGWKTTRLYMLSCTTLSNEERAGLQAC